MNREPFCPMFFLFRPMCLIPVAQRSGSLPWLLADAASKDTQFSGNTLKKS